MVDVRPMAPFSYLYPFPRQTLMDIAYYFDFDYADGRTPELYAEQAIALTRAWMADGARGMLEMRARPDGTLRLLDTRRELAAAPRQAVLSGWKAACYLACDRAQGMGALRELPEVHREHVADDELRAFLERCVSHRLMVRCGQSWLGVAIHVPARMAPDHEVHEVHGVH